MRLAGLASAVLASSLLLAGCVTDGLTAASGQFIKAATLTDDDMVQMAADGIVELDAENRVAPPQSPYTKRLAELTRTYTAVNGRPLRFKVYLKAEANAFAMADGSVRVYSGLMDLMTDDELKFVIGHEIGHVALSHTKRAMQVAYAARGVRQVAAAQGGTGGRLAAGELGGLVEAVVNAQFSQAEETESDEYGLSIAVKAKAQPTAAVVALRKLGDGRSPDALRQLLASHPAPAARADHLNQLVAQKYDSGAAATEVAAAPTPAPAPTAAPSPAPTPAPATAAAPAPAPAESPGTNTDVRVASADPAPVHLTPAPGGASRGMAPPLRHRTTAGYADDGEEHAGRGVYAHLASYNDDGFVDRVIEKYQGSPWLQGRSLTTHRLHMGVTGRPVIRLIVRGFASTAEARRFCQGLRGSWSYCQPVHG